MKHVLLTLIALSLSACASAPPVQSEAYARLKDHRVFEYGFPVVWKAVEDAFREFKVTDRDPSEVSELEMRDLSRRVLKTDWVYSRSPDKYVEYSVNGSPRRQLLQERTRYTIEAQRVIGGVEVSVHPTEEIERLNADGSVDGYHSSPEPDSARASGILDQINHSILAAPPSGAAP